MKMILNTDGGARGNPGPGAAGVVLRNEKGEVIKELGVYLGRCTNNEAEYKALILGLNSAKEFVGSELICNLDSELVVKQLNKEYKIKEPRMRELFEQIQNLLPAFSKVVFRHVPRKENSHADRLVNEVLDANS